MDSLVGIFQRQATLQAESFGVDFAAMTPLDRIEFIKNMKLALEAELQEALDETGWKTWATSRHINRDAFEAELVDALHFLVNMFLVSGDDPEVLALRVYDRYMVKAARNAQRQMEGYDGVSSKCPMCRRALDDPDVHCEVTKYTSDGKNLL